MPRAPALLGRLDRKSLAPDLLPTARPFRCSIPSKERLSCNPFARPAGEKEARGTRWQRQPTVPPLKAHSWNLLVGDIGSAEMGRKAQGVDLSAYNCSLVVNSTASRNMVCGRPSVGRLGFDLQLKARTHRALRGVRISCRPANFPTVDVSASRWVHLGLSCMLQGSPVGTWQAWPQSLKPWKPNSAPWRALFSSG